MRLIVTKCRNIRLLQWYSMLQFCSFKLACLNYKNIGYQDSIKKQCYFKFTYSNFQWKSLYLNDKEQDKPQFWQLGYRDAYSVNCFISSIFKRMTFFLLQLHLFFKEICSDLFCCIRKSRHSYPHTYLLYSQISYFIASPPQSMIEMCCLVVETGRTYTTAAIQGSKTAGELMYRSTFSDTVARCHKENQESNQKNAGTLKVSVWMQEICETSWSNLCSNK